VISPGGKADIYPPPPTAETGGDGRWMCHHKPDSVPAFAWGSGG